jgi:hypothetical protein
MAGSGTPTRFPIFPLPNVVLFPDVKLPLHIFEPRYRKMTADSLAGDRTIGMTLLRPGILSDQGRSPVFDVGCAGRIAEHVALPDGRFQLLLEGAFRFRIRAELAGDDPYRWIDAELLADPEPAGAAKSEFEGVLQRIEAHMSELLRRHAPKAQSSIEARLRSLEARELLHALAFGLEIPVVEKQSLLEAPGLLRRGQLLLDLLEMRAAERRLPDAPRTLN